MQDKRASRILAALWTAIAVSPVFAQSRDTLETKATATGNLVVIEWSKKHPWDAELLAGSATLMAEYLTREGKVASDCLTPSPASRFGRSGFCAGLPNEPRRGREDRSFRFRLPESLTAVPAGPVCLHVRVNGQKPLPLRKAADGVVDTARFRSESWELEAVRRTEAAGLQLRVDQLKSAVERAAQSAANQETINTTKGWKDGGACSQISTPELSAIDADRPLAAPAARDAIARRVCIMRVVRATGILEKEASSVPALRALEGFSQDSDHFNFVYAPSVLASILALNSEAARDEAFASRMQQLQQFHADWQRWMGTVVAYRKESVKPHFGGFGDLLYLQSATVMAGRNLAASAKRGEPAAAIDLRGFVGASIEAYDRCIADGKNQMETSWKNAQELKEQTPATREKIRLEMVSACESGIRKLETLRNQHTSLKEELERAQQALSAIAVSPLSSTPQPLNFAVCSPNIAAARSK